MALNSMITNNSAQVGLNSFASIFNGRVPAWMAGSTGYRLAAMDKRAAFSVARKLRGRAGFFAAPRQPGHATGFLSMTSIGFSTTSLNGTSSPSTAQPPRHS